MSYAVRAILNRDEAAKQKFYGIYGWHNAAWGLFPRMPDVKREDLGFLFRVDENEDEFRLTVASKIEPHRPSWCPKESWLCRLLEPEYLKYKKYRFKIYVNPTRTTRKNVDQSPREKKYGRHEAILRNPELREWFLHKAEQNGFKVLDAPELDISPPVFHKLTKNGHDGTIIGIDFRGILEVTDRELFKKTFEKGIGKARSFGFGLLVVQPIQ